MLLINNDNIIESIDCMLPINGQEERVYYIYEIIKDIALIEVYEA
jgi:hypothetical protein